MRTDTLVIGAGQAGLSASYHLSRLGREHLDVDSGAIGETWRSRRWDSLTLVTPSWSIRLPGLDEPPGDPDGFLPRAGQPIHDAGVTRERGFACVGLRFQRWAKSDLFLGVGDDARLVVEPLVGEPTARMPA